MLFWIISSERSSGCPLLLSIDLIEFPAVCFQSLRIVVLSCLFSLFLWLHAWCFHFCTTSICIFGKFSEVGLLAILTDVFVFVDKFLQASVLVFETVRTNGHQVGFSHSSPVIFQPSTWCLVRAFLHCFVASALLTWYANYGQLCVALQQFLLPPRSSLRRNEFERYLVCLSYGDRVERPELRDHVETTLRPGWDHVETTLRPGWKTKLRPTLRPRWHQYETPVET